MIRKANIVKMIELNTISHKIRREIAYPYTSAITSSIKSTNGKTNNPPGANPGPTTTSL
jgi:hypothetical protein